MGDEDPYPEFHYISPKLVSCDIPIHARSQPRAVDAAISPVSVHSSSTSSFVEIDLNNDEDECSAAPLLAPTSGSSHSVCTSSDDHSPSAIVISTVTTVTVVEEVGLASEGNCEEVAVPCHVADQDKNVVRAQVAGVSVLHKVCIV